jgi:hypothetical protein
MTPAEQYLSDAHNLHDDDWAYFDDRASCECLWEVYKILRSSNRMHNAALEAIERIEKLIEKNAVEHEQRVVENA